MLNQETNLKQHFWTATDQIICAVLNFILKREQRKSAFPFSHACPQQRSKRFDSMAFHITNCINISHTVIKYTVALIYAVIPITGTNTIFFPFPLSNYVEYNRCKRFFWNKYKNLQRNIID